MTLIDHDNYSLYKCPKCDFHTYDYAIRSWNNLGNKPFALFSDLYSSPWFYQDDLVHCRECHHTHFKNERVYLGSIPKKDVDQATKKAYADADDEVIRPSKTTFTYDKRIIDLDLSLGGLNIFSLDWLHMSRTSFSYNNHLLSYTSTEPASRAFRFVEIPYIVFTTYEKYRLIKETRPELFNQFPAYMQNIRAVEEYDPSEYRPNPDEYQPTKEELYRDGLIAYSGNPQFLTQVFEPIFELIISPSFIEDNKNPRLEHPLNGYYSSPAYFLSVELSRRIGYFRTAQLHLEKALKPYSMDINLFDRWKTMQQEAITQKNRNAFILHPF